MPRFPGNFQISILLSDEDLITTFYYSVKAAEFLHGIDSEFFRAIEESGMLDEQQNPEDVTADCQEVFPQHHQCQNITNSDSYRFPGRKNWKKFIPLLNKFS